MLVKKVIICSKKHRRLCLARDCSEREFFAKEYYPSQFWIHYLWNFEKFVLSRKNYLTKVIKPRYSWINQLSLLLMKYINLLTTNLKLDAFFFPHLKLLTKFGIKVLLYLGKFLNYKKQRVFLYDNIQNGKMLKPGFLRVGRYFS